MKLQLKINNQWAILPDDASISIVQTSPLFSSDKGDISYPFELDIQANRHIFGNIADTHGYVRLREYNNLPVEIWYDGLQFFAGRTEIDDTVEFSGDTITINVVTANKSFADAIDGMKCRDVELIDDIVIGGVPKAASVPTASISGQVLTMNDINVVTVSRALKILFPDSQFYVQSSSSLWMELRKSDVPVDAELAKFLIPLNHSGDGNVICTNTRLPYPEAKYCNVKLCQPLGNDEGSSSDSQGNGYNTIEPSSVNAAPSFYVMYFLDCLFRKIGMLHTKDDILRIEDLNRLAMLNAFPRYRESDEQMYYDTDDISYESAGARYVYSWYYRRFKYIVHYNGKDYTSQTSQLIQHTPDISLCRAYATSENFPDVDVADVINSLENGFGVMFDYDARRNSMTLRLKRDIMRSTDVRRVDCVIINEYVSRNKYNGVKLTYGSDDLAYNYDTTADTVAKLGWSEYAGYDNIVSSNRSTTDTTTKYDVVTGRTYRIKVNEDTGDEPQLFGVADYHDCIYGRADDGSEEPEEIKLPFLPVTINDIWAWRQSINGNVNARPAGASDSELAVFVKEEAYGKTAPMSSIDGRVVTGQLQSNGITESVTKTYTSNDGKISVDFVFDIQTYLAGPAVRDISEEDSKYPLEKYDAGLQLGILRGPGAPGGIVVTDYNYDGEGNDSWVEIPESTGGFTPDSVDLWGNPYDYNGSEQGGASLDGRLSLLLDARKIKSYTNDGDPRFYDISGKVGGVPADKIARRGLVPQLLEDYLYFMAHKSEVTLEIELSLAELINLPYDKRVSIGTHVGFIYSKSYTISHDGIGFATIVLYELNK